MTRRYVIRTRLASQRYSDLATRGKPTQPALSAGIPVCLASKCSFFLVRRFSLASGGLVPRVIPAGRIEVDFVTLASRSRSERQRPAERHCRARARCYRYLPEHGAHPPQLLIRRMAQALRENLANSRFIANGDERPQKQRSISRRVRSVHFVLGRGRNLVFLG